MTKTTFKIGNTSNANYSFPKTDYSKILDNIIATNIIENNKYLFDNNKSDDIYAALIKDTNKKYCPFCGLLKDDEFIKATNYLANYKKFKKIPYTIGKTYKLIDGTPIAFFDDEIQIGYDIYKYTDFSDFSFLNKLTEPTKKIIINIFNAGGKNININII